MPRRGDPGVGAGELSQQRVGQGSGDVSGGLDSPDDREGQGVKYGPRIAGVSTPWAAECTVREGFGHVSLGIWFEKANVTI
jgi:hypothetical protein